jgi:cytochrome c-type biogenesis protein CcmH
MKTRTPPVILSRVDGEGPPSRSLQACLSALLLAFVVFAAQAQVTDTAGALKVPDAAQFVGAPKGQPIAGETLNLRTNQVGGLLRCPVCQGMSVADSPAEMAVNMKGQVRELLARGYTEEQILKYFELSYGQFVLLKPKFEGVTSMVWLLPLIALIAGGAVLYFAFRRLAAPALPPTANSQPPTAPADDAYLARVRDLVSGDKP